MKTLALKEVRIDKLLLPGDWVEILAHKDVAARAKSIHEVGLIHEPVVRRSDMKLLAGRHRVAAHVFNGEETCVVKLVDCTDEEALDIEEVENIERRHSPKEQSELRMRRLDRLEKLAAAEMEAQRALEEAHGKIPSPGRPKSPRAEARRRMAEEEGISESSVRNREMRHRKREEAERAARDEAERERAKRKEQREAVDDLGMELEEEFAAKLGAMKRLAIDCRKRMANVRGAITRLRNAELPVDHGDLERILAAADSMTAALKRLEPTHVCPYCKGVGGVQESCGGCAGKGWRHGTDGVPKQLLSLPPMVSVGGQFVLVTDLEEEEDPWPI